MVFKETYIRWINTDSQTYIKIMYSIVIETIFYFNDVINNYSICGPTYFILEAKAVVKNP